MKSMKLPCSIGVARVAIVVVSAILLVACGSTPTKREIPTAVQERRDQGMEMWKERCERSGFSIHKTIQGVDGIYLVNVRMRANFGESVEDQFALDDPYGRDSIGDNYILNFFHGFYYRTLASRPTIPGAPPRVGYRFVETIDPKDGRLYRFTGRIKYLRSPDEGKADRGWEIHLERTPIDQRSARFGVRFDDISTRKDRQHWIAGSSLKVIDLETDDVIAERIGYMVDRAQGSRAGNRSPWLFAADTACPDFHRNPNSSIRNGAAAQMGQTLDFVEQVLRPTLQLSN